MRHGHTWPSFRRCSRVPLFRPVGIKAASCRRIVRCEARRLVVSQITSNPHSDPDAVKITAANLVKGTLSSISFVRPAKLFTANETLMDKRVAILDDATFSEILAIIINWLQGVMPVQGEVNDVLPAAEDGDG